MKTKVNLFRSLAMIITGFAGGLEPGFAEEASVSTTETRSVPSEVEVVGNICPRFIWMNHGTYYSYYSQKSPSCAAVNYDSTSNSLATLTPCESGGAGCPPALKAKDENGTAVDANDPGVKGYGHGQPVGVGDKRGRLVRASGNRPWPGQSNRLAVSHVDDFEINFGLPNGTSMQAQVMVVTAKIASSGDPLELLGRANEIQRFNNPRPPSAGTVGNVTPVADRPHAFEFEYTPRAGGAPVKIEIITHHSTPGHGDRVAGG